MLYRISDFLLTVFIGNYINIDQFGDEFENKQIDIFRLTRLDLVFLHFLQSSNEFKASYLKSFKLSELLF